MFLTRRLVPGLYLMLVSAGMIVAQTVPQNPASAQAIRSYTSKIKSYEIRLRRIYAEPRAEVSALQVSDGKSLRYDLQSIVHGRDAGRRNVTRTYERDGVATSFLVDEGAKRTDLITTAKRKEYSAGLLYVPHQILGKPLDQIVEDAKWSINREGEPEVVAKLGPEETVTVVLDPKQHFLAKSYRVEGKTPSGQREVRVVFSGWRAFDGISIPTKISNTEKIGDEVVEQFDDVVDEATFNGSVEAALTPPKWTPGANLIDLDKSMKYVVNADGTLRTVGPTNQGGSRPSPFSQTGLMFVAAFACGVYVLFRTRRIGHP